MLITATPVYQQYNDRQETKSLLLSLILLAVMFHYYTFQVMEHCRKNHAPTQNPYDILGVKKDASEAEIKSVYRKLAKQHHPELNPDKKDTDKKQLSYLRRTNPGSVSGFFYHLYPGVVIDAGVKSNGSSTGLGKFGTASSVGITGFSVNHDRFG